MESYISLMMIEATFRVNAIANNKMDGKVNYASPAPKILIDFINQDFLLVQGYPYL